METKSSSDAFDNFSASDAWAITQEYHRKLLFEKARPVLTRIATHARNGNEYLANIALSDGVVGLLIARGFRVISSSPSEPLYTIYWGKE